jgi:hypothetical protein
MGRTIKGWLVRLTTIGGLFAPGSPRPMAINEFVGQGRSRRLDLSATERR